MSVLEYKTITLKTISPVYIQGKDIEYGCGFVRRDNNTAYAINSQKLAEFLFNKTSNLSLVENYVNKIEESAKSNKLKDFDNEGFLYNSGIYHHKKNRTYEKELIEKGVFKAIVSAPSEGKFMKDALGRAVIPGSSIKGVFRTAVMYHIVKKLLENMQDNPVKSFINNISDEISNFKKKTKNKPKHLIDIEKRKFSQHIQQYIFQNTEMKMKTHLDFFRAVKVKDSEVISGLSTQKAILVSLDEPVKKQILSPTPNLELNGKIGRIIQYGLGFKVEYQGEEFDFTSKVYNKYFDLFKKNVNKNIRILKAGSKKISKFELTSEELPENSKVKLKDKEKEKFPIKFSRKDNNQPVEFKIETFTGTTKFTITLDTYLLEKYFKKNQKILIPFSNIDSLLKIIKEFGKDVWFFEKSFFDSCTDDKLNVSTVRNFYAKSIDNIFRIGWGTGLSGMTIFMLLKKEHQILLRNFLTGERYEDNLPSPKTRRLLYKNNQITLPLGWGNFQ